jgi:hypothetical protein
VTRHSQHLPPVEAMLLRLTPSHTLMLDSARRDTRVLPPRVGFRCRHHTDVGASPLYPPNIDCTPPGSSRRRCTTETLKIP